MYFLKFAHMFSNAGFFFNLRSADEAKYMKKETNIELANGCYFCASNYVMNSLNDVPTYLLLLL